MDQRVGQNKPRFFYAPRRRLLLPGRAVVLFFHGKGGLHTWNLVAGEARRGRACR
jgi:hypothetical protein